MPDKDDVSLCRFPKPYGAMLAISTDIDHTTITNFRETHRYMNTKAETAMGRGLGLDVGNSMWVYKKASRPAGKFAVNSQIAYFTGTDSANRSPIADELIDYAHAGWIDTLHSYGDFSQATNGAFTRKHAEDALDVLGRHGVRLPVWVNHGNSNNTQNIGTADWMQGDVVGAAAYHADLMAASGVTFIGTEHIAEFGEQQPIRPFSLCDGRELWAFRRFARFVDLPGSAALGARYGVPYANKKGQDILWVWHPRALHLQLSNDLLDQAAAEGRFVILAQHLGSGGPLNAFGEQAAAALRCLAERHDRGDILVTRSSRLLEYYRVISQLNYAVVGDGDAVSIDIRSIDDKLSGPSVPTVEQLRGVTFGIRRGRPAGMNIAGKPIPEALIERSTSADGMSTLAVRWHDPDHTDYTEPFRNRPDAISLIPRIDGLAVDQTLLADRLQDTLPASLAASYAERLSKAQAHVSRIGFAGRSGVRALVVGCTDELQPLALSLLNDGKSQVNCIEPSMVRRNECAQAAGALEIGRSLSFHDDMTPLYAEGPDDYHAMWLGEWAQGEDPETLFNAVARRLKHKNHAYMLYPGPGFYLERAAERIDQMPEEAGDTIAQLFSGMCYKAGLGRNGHGLHVLDHEALFEALRLLGLRSIESPGFLGMAANYGGYPAAFDVVLERNANDKKKYFVPNTEEAFTAEKVKDARWLKRIEHLVDIGLPRLAARILDANPAARQERPMWAATKALALAKSGLPIPADLMSAVDSEAIRARVLASMANADYEQALTLTSRGDGDDIAFLRGVSLLKLSRLKEASDVFGAAHAKTASDLALVGLLYTFMKRDELGRCAALLKALQAPLGDSQRTVASAPTLKLRPTPMAADQRSGTRSLRRPGQVHVISVVGISFCGSSVLNLVLGSHPEIHGGGELHKLFIAEKHPRCSVCQYDCDHWTSARLLDIKRSGLYRQMSATFDKRVIADTSKTINHFEATHPLNTDTSYDYLILIKHPIRHVASYVNNKFVVNRGLASSLRTATTLAHEEQEIVDYVDKRFARLIRDYQDIHARLQALSRDGIHTIGKYESFVQNPRAFLEPILQRAELGYDEGMLDYVSKTHHPIGGNRGPHYQINKKLSTSRFVGYRKNFYEDNDGLALDDKYLNTFSGSQLETIKAMDSYQRVCTFLGYDPDIETRASPR